METLRVALTLAAKNSWSAAGFDIRTAFLRAPIPEGRPHGLRPPAILEQFGLAEPNEIWEVRKLLYGFREAPRYWSEFRDEVLRKLKFQSGGKSYKSYAKDFLRQIFGQSTKKVRQRKAQRLNLVNSVTEASVFLAIVSTFNHSLGAGIFDLRFSGTSWARSNSPMYACCDNRNPPGQVSISTPRNLKASARVLGGFATCRPVGQCSPICQLWPDEDLQPTPMAGGTTGHQHEPKGNHAFCPLSGCAPCTEVCWRAAVVEPKDQTRHAVCRQLEAVVVE